MKTILHFPSLNKMSKSFLIIAFIVCWGSLIGQNINSGLQLHYDFSTESIVGTSVTDVSGNSNITGELNGTATIDEYFGKPAMHIPAQRDDDAGIEIADLYKLMNTLSGDYSISLDVYAGKNYIKRGWLFGYSASTDEYICLHTNNHQYAITEASWNNEQSVSSSGDYAKEEWTKATYVQEGNIGRLYLNGELKSSNANITLRPADFEGKSNLRGHLARNNVWNNGVTEDVYLADFRIYNRALSVVDIWTLMGFSTQEITAKENLQNALIFLNSNEGLNSIYEYPLSEVYPGDRLNLMTSLPNYEGVILSWSTSDPQVISTDGTAHQTEGISIVKLTVTLTHPDTDVVLTKDFTATVISDALPEIIASWNFTDAVYSREAGRFVLASTGTEGSKSYTGTFENGASKRTIGLGDNRFTVLDLGNKNGYFDMGQAFGQIIYQLGTGYAMGGYFLVEDDALDATSSGNFLCCFSNSPTQTKDKNGSIFIRPWASTFSITTGRWDTQPRNSVAKNDYFVNSTEPTETKPAYLGTWHHILYAQTGNTGTIYIDGVAVTQETVDLIPAQLKIDDRKGTNYNYLGRSQYVDNGDKYLNKALLYDFKIFGYGLSADDVQTLDITPTLQKLNTAYLTNAGKELSADLIEAADLLDVPTEILGAEIYPGDNIALITSLNDYPNIDIAWSASNPDIMDDNGNFIHHYYDSDISMLRALLIDLETGQSLLKEIPIDAVVKAGKTLNSTDKGKLVQFDFSQVQATTVSDVINNISGNLKNNAKIRTIGEEGNKFNVLDLGDDNGYLDMDKATGQIVANLRDNYAITAYYYIDEAYADNEFLSNGNFLWTFANSDNSGADSNGYFIFSAGQQRVEMTSATFNTEGIVNLPIEKDINDKYVSSTKGEWYFVAITGEEGLVDDEKILNYYAYRTDAVSDEILMSSVSIDMIKTPRSDLLKPDRIGTYYNWIGRSSWVNDKYLRKTLVYDFRIYDKGLTQSDFESAEFGDVRETLKSLAAAYKANPNATNGINIPTQKSPYTIYTSEKNIHIIGLNGNEQINLYNIAGRELPTNSDGVLRVENTGVYILRINEHSMKVIIR